MNLRQDARDWREVLRAAFPRPLAIACLVVVLAEVILAFAVLRSGADLRPHNVPATVVAPSVMSEPLAAELNGLPGTPFDLTATEDEGGARSDVEQGRIYAALVVDLRSHKDRLLVSTALDPQMVDAVVSQVQESEDAWGRSAALERVGPPDGEKRLARAHLVTLLACLLGFLITVGSSLKWGPVARSFRRGLARLGGMTAGSAVAGLILGIALTPGAFATKLAVGLAAALVALCSGAVTAALESVAGWAGLGLAVLAFFATALPVLTRTDQHLIPPPWNVVTGAGIPVAGLQSIAQASLRGTLDGGPILILGAWLAAALLLLGYARSARTRAARVHATGAEPATRSQSRAHARANRWRVRVIAVVAPLTVALLAAAAVVPQQRLAEPAEIASHVYTSECISTGPVKDVDDLNRLASLRGAPLFRGADVGASAPLQDGRTLWMFGDTLRDAGTGPRMVRNSMLILAPDCIQGVFPPSDGAIIPGRPRSTVGYWPMSVVVDRHDGYDLVYVTTQRVQGKGDGAFDFDNLGLAVATFLVPKGGVPQRIDQQDIGPDQPGREAPTWGAAAASVSGDDGDWVYLFGTANPGTDQAFGWSLQVARMRPKDITNQQRWRYWDGSAWVTRESRAQILIPAREGVSQTLSVFEQDGGWYAVSKRNDFIGSDVTVWTAPAPTGPWSSGTAVAPIESKTGQLRYMPLAHPELFPKKGTVVVSYSNNDADLDRVIDDPLRYRPKFLRIALPEGPTRP